MVRSGTDIEDADGLKKPCECANLICSRACNCSYGQVERYFIKTFVKLCAEKVLKNAYRLRLKLLKTNAIRRGRVPF